MNRRKSREIAMKLLYQVIITKDSSEDAINNFKEMNGEDKDIDFEYIKRVLEGMQEHKEEIDNTIETYLKGWTLKRISKVNISILRLAVYEIMNEEDIPKKVSVNEAVELAKKFSEDKAPSFINGVLDKIIKNV